MNLISYILLGIIIVAFLAVLRYVHRGGGKKSCCKGCNGCCESKSSCCH